MKLGLGTIVKILSDYGHKGMIGMVIECDDLPPWAIALVKLDSGCYAFSKNEVEIV